MKTKLIINIDELNEYEHEWNEVVQNSINSEVFFTYEWMKAFIKHFDKNSVKYFIVIAIENKKIIGIAPLAIREKKVGFSKVNVLQTLVNRTSDYSDFYFDKNYNGYEIMKNILKVIYEKKEHWDYIELTNFNTRSSSIFLIQELALNYFKSECFLEQSIMTPYFNYGIDEVKINKKQMKDIERREKKLIGDNEITINVGSEWNEEVWKALIEFHKAKWEKSIFYNSQYIDFYEEAIKTLYEKDMVEFSYIKIGDDIGAIHFGFKNHKKVYYYIPIYNPKYATTGVGTILLKHIFDHYKTSKTEFDFLRGNELYKFYWTDKLHMNYNIYISDKLYLKLYIKLLLAAKKSKTLRRILKK